MTVGDEHTERPPLSATRVFQENRPYGDPMRDALASGDVNEMRRVHSFASQWLTTAEREIAEVRQTLSRLEDAIGKLEP